MLPDSFKQSQVSVHKSDTYSELTIDIWELTKTNSSVSAKTLKPATYNFPAIGGMLSSVCTLYHHNSNKAVPDTAPEHYYYYEGMYQIWDNASGLGYLQAALYLFVSSILTWISFTWTRLSSQQQHFTIRLKASTAVNMFNYSSII